MAHFPMTIVIPVKNKNGITQFPKVGTILEVHDQKTGDVSYTFKPVLPVGAIEAVGFLAPKPCEGCDPVSITGAAN